MFPGCAIQTHLAGGETDPLFHPVAAGRRADAVFTGVRQSNRTTGRPGSLGNLGLMKNKSGILVAAALAGSCALLAQGPAPADQPVSRTDPNSLTAHAQLLEKASKGGIDIYFEGDSITRRWGATDYPDWLANWKQNFFGWNAADFGWGADTIQNILWRLNNGELDGVNPKVIVLLAGTNNVGARASAAGQDEKVADITKGLQAVVNLMQRKAPNATIIVTAIFPRNDNMAFMPVIDKINSNLAQLAGGRKIRFLNVNDKLAGPDGRLFDGIMNDRDKVHPQLKGYQVWADGLKPIFTELLGPPSKEDHAPPPTGDPSAKK
jgi:lysophospholipase L1-like esterase